MCRWRCLVATTALFLSSHVLAAVYLVSDPYPSGTEQPTGFVVQCGTQSYSIAAALNSSGLAYLSWLVPSIPQIIAGCVVWAVDSKVGATSATEAIPVPPAPGVPLNLYISVN
jgi:hypothetical protein